MTSALFKKSDISNDDNHLKKSKSDLESMVQSYFDSFIDSHPNFYEINDLHAVVCQEVEKVLIQKVMKKTNHNQSKAAKVLGLNRNTLRNKLNLYKID
ncbi:MAG: Fis family transcriptional regulator [Rickettsiales bacterium]|nr:Fis family transcriptional regulator [Rickettsiales bacterium]|tara:strand:- start:43638 stop:43931 length:294 start_codon:yes stop_codon:yes gene_type:complete